MPTASLWEQTLTFFPQFRRALAEVGAPGATVAIVGASDGKFVLPLAEGGFDVIAFENDPIALYGGEVLLPVSGFAHAPGLIDRLKAAELDHRVQPIETDFLDADITGLVCDAVWTSCSWHYSVNHRRPLSEFLGRMQRLVKPGGLFGAEFMMPVQPHHHRIEHYTTPDRLGRYFHRGWTMLLTLQTDEFTERAHVGQPHDHTHRMGLIIATKHPRDDRKGEQ